MRARRAVLIGLAIVVAATAAVAVVRATSHTERVAAPTAQTLPVDVVRALDERDNATCRAIDLQGCGGGGMFAPSPAITDLRIDRIGTVVSGTSSTSQLAAQQRWEQTVTIDTTATLDGLDGTDESHADQPWSYLLVRHDATQPWRILYQGQG